MKRFIKVFLIVGLISFGLHASDTADIQVSNSDGLDIALKFAGQAAQQLSDGARLLLSVLLRKECYSVIAPNAEGKASGSMDDYQQCLNQNVQAGLAFVTSDQSRDLLQKCDQIASSASAIAKSGDSDLMIGLSLGLLNILNYSQNQTDKSLCNDPESRQIGMDNYCQCIDSQPDFNGNVTCVIDGFYRFATALEKQLTAGKQQSTAS